MNCKRTQLEISLWVTNDLKDSSLLDLEKHIAQCPNCELFRRNLQKSLSSLKNGTCVPKVDLNDSIWPDIESELPNYHEMQKTSRFNGWMVAIAFTVACAAMVTFSSQQNYFSWPGDGAYEIDGRLFSTTSKQIDGYHGFRRDTKADLQSPTPNKIRSQLNKKQDKSASTELEDNATPND